MQRISSRTTFLNKRLFPAMWFGFLILFVATFLFDSHDHSAALPVLLLTAAMAAIGYIAMKRLVFTLADEVFDEGDALRVRFGREEERIPLAEIINIGWTMMINPQRVTLTLRNAGRFGKEVSFSPQRPFWPWARSPIIDDLIERVDLARRRQ